MELHLPEIYSTKKTGTKTKKNNIIHLIKDKAKVIGDADTIERTCFILKVQNDVEYFITSNKKNIPEDKSHVILCHKFKKEDISSSNFKTIKWLKNP